MQVLQMGFDAKTIDKKLNYFINELKIKGMSMTPDLFVNYLIESQQT